MRLQHENISLELVNFGRIPSHPNWTSKAHAHNHYEIHFITGGKGLNRIETGDLEFFPNIVYLAPPHEKHAQWSDGKSPLELYYINFVLNLADKTKPLPRIYAPFSFVKSELDRIYQISNNTSSSGLFLTKLRLLELIWKVIEPYALETGAIYYTGNPLKTNWSVGELEKAVLFIQKNFLRNPSLTEVAEDCKISPRHLSRLFMQNLGMTPHRFVQNERYTWAVAELRYSTAHYREIAEALHFSSSQYFSGWFKQISTMTPTEFRKYYQLL